MAGTAVAVVVAAGVRGDAFQPHRVRKQNPLIDGRFQAEMAEMTRQIMFLCCLIFDTQLAPASDGVRFNGGAEAAKHKNLEY